MLGPTILDIKKLSTPCKGCGFIIDHLSVLLSSLSGDYSKITIDKNGTLESWSGDCPSCGYFWEADLNGNVNISDIINQGNSRNNMEKKKDLYLEQLESIDKSLKSIAKFLKDISGSLKDIKRRRSLNAS